MNRGIKKEKRKYMAQKKMEDAPCLISRLRKEVQRSRKCDTYIRVRKHSNRVL